MLPEGLHFIRPIAFWLLIPTCYLIWQLLQRIKAAKQWQAACDVHLLPYLLEPSATRFAWWPISLLGIAWLLAIIALAGPSWSHTAQPVYRLQNARVIILDLSQAMYAADITPDRLTRAKYKTLDLLQRSREGQVGMVVFAGEPHVVSPLTQDAATITAMVPVLSPAIMPAPGAKIGIALKKAASLLKQAGVARGQVILISCNTVTTADIAIAQQLQQQGIIISVLGIGTAQGAPIPERNGFIRDQSGQIYVAKLNSDALKALANAGAGAYADLSNDDQDINRLLAVDNLREQNQRAQKTQLTAENWLDQGCKFISPILALAILVFRRGWIHEVTKCS